MRGLYIHIPFCQTRCSYCDFVTTAEHSPAIRERFFQAVSLETIHTRDRYGALVFDTLYLGGGTPSSLSIPELGRLVELIRSTFRFSEGFEFTCEFNPGDGDEAKLKALREMGVDRISLGCQSFRDRILEKLGRRHTVQDIETTVSKMRQAGILNISFDLMLRLPGQTVEDFRDSVRRCIDLEASQVSLYDLEVHGKTPLGELQQKGALDLPPEEEHARMYENAIEMLIPAGYEHYEISNFAKPGLASRHNLLYWRNQEYLGLGPGAFTYLGGVRSQFAPDLGRYLEKCEAKDWTKDVEDLLSEEDQETETFITGLRLCEGVAPAAFKRIYPDLKGRLKTLHDNGFLEVLGDRSRLTRRGKFLAEDVFAFLLQKDSSSGAVFL